MNSTEVFSDTDIAQAKLVSQLSNRPAKVQNDIFIWNGHLIDRATAIVALLKINNQVPVGDGVKMRLHQEYDRRFAAYEDKEDLVKFTDEQPDKAARIWFNILCRTIKGKEETLSKERVKQILIDLHS
jgi:hypothetical protein